MQYLDAMRDPDFEPGGDGKKLRWGCSVVGWFVFALLLVAVAIFSVKFFNYYQKLKSGGYVELPQALNSLTTRDDMVLGSTQAVVPDSELITGDSAAYGASAEDAKLVIVEFGDFGCSFCQKVSLPLRTVVERYKDRVRLIYRHYPSEKIHPDSVLAAQASECAAEQGRFWAMYDKLYLNSPNLGFSDLKRYANEIGLDTTQFEICLVDERYLPRVNRDVNTSRAIGVVGTPTFYFNGQVAVGALPIESLEKIIELFLSQER